MFWFDCEWVISVGEHFSKVVAEKLVPPFVGACSVLTGMPAIFFMAIFTGQDVSNTNKIAAITKKYRLQFIEIFGIVLFINLQK